MEIFFIACKVNTDGSSFTRDGQRVCIAKPLYQTLFNEVFMIEIDEAGDAD